MASNIIFIEDIKNLRDQISTINSMNLRDILFFEDGKRVYFTEKLYDDFEFTGLNNIDFICSGFYKGSG